LILAATPAWADPAATAIPRGVVRVSARHNHPDLGAPWQHLRPHKVEGSGAVVSGRRILTNAHVVEDASMIEVQTSGSSRTFTAEPLFVSHELDLALLGVEDEAFFAGVTPLEVGELPALQAHVSVFGFPEGGSAASVTSGVVSRIEVAYYTHSNEYFLRGQIDAAINSGNSGGPVVDASGRIAGVAMQVLKSSENIGYMVPAPVVAHFLKDVADGRLDGVPDLGLHAETLENPSLRKSLDLPDDVGGTMVVVIAPGAARSKLHVGDVLTAYDGVPIDRDGKVTLENGLRVEASYLEMSKQVGEPIRVSYLRDGTPNEVTLGSSHCRRLLRTRAEDGNPRYFVYGGLVFQPLSTQYVSTMRPPPAWAYLYYSEATHGAFATLIDPEPRLERDEVVIISSVLTDDVNRGYDFATSSTVWSVDGKTVKSFDDLVQRIENGKKPFVEIVTDSGMKVVLERSAVAARGAAILARYGIERDRALDAPAAPLR
jgi:S1-C subfamily serine protease